MGNLTTLKEDLREIKYANLAEIIIKYQNFKSAVILNKMQNMDIKEATKLQYITAGIKYIRYRKKDKKFSDVYYKKIQELLDKHMQPLVPKENEKRSNIQKIYQQKETILPIQNIIKSIKQTTTIEYGIKIEDKILLCIDEIEARSFIKAIKFINSNCEAKIVTLEINDYKEGK